MFYSLPSRAKPITGEWGGGGGVPDPAGRNQDGFGSGQISDGSLKLQCIKGYLKSVLYHEDRPGSKPGI